MSKKNQKIISKQIKLIDETTPFAIKESFNQLRTNLMYTAKHGIGCPIYGVTSAEASVGKSTIVANLALSFSNIGKKVLLIDADMRRPVQFRFFGYEKKRPGLSELLSGIVKNDAEVITEYSENFNIITSGIIPPNPAELILSDKLEELVEKWHSEYDIVFIDLPPVGIVADSLSISKLLDGYIFVAMANRSNATRVNNSIQLLKQVDAKIVGLVLNGTSLKGAGKHRYSSSKYRYSYKYGYKYGYSYYTDND